MGCTVTPYSVNKNGAPSTRQEVVEEVQATLQRAGVDPTHYSARSLLITALVASLVTSLQKK